MKLEMFCLYDAKVQAFARPFFALSRGEAIRIVTDVARSGDNTVSAHPGDFGLFVLGGFDQQTGAVHGFEPVALGLVSSLMPPVEAPPLLKVMEGGK